MCHECKSVFFAGAKLSSEANLQNAYANMKEAYFRNRFKSLDYILWKKKLPQRDRRYEKMVLLMLDYLIWLTTAGSFILWEKIVTFMAGRTPSKGLRAWQKHRDGDCDWGQDNTEAAWIWDLWEIGETLRSNGGSWFLPWHVHSLTHTHTKCANNFNMWRHCCSCKQANNGYRETNINFISIAGMHLHTDTHIQWGSSQ